MQNPIKPDSGVYVVVYRKQGNEVIPHPRFCNYPLKPGYYIYCGSAQKNLLKRARRHSLSENKKLRWHIDYLTVTGGMEYIETYLVPGLAKEGGCLLTEFISHRLGAAFPLPGFGSSDCKKCTSHLLYLDHKPALSSILSRFPSAVLIESWNSSV